MSATHPSVTTDAERASAVYDEAVRSTFAFLKATTRLDDLHAKAVELASDSGYLLPVCELHAGDERLIETLARWRDDNQHAYPTRFPVTLEGTARWLRAGVLDVEDRMLFLVCDRFGRPVGHLGFASALQGERSVEVDNVVRGERDAPGLMSLAMHALCAWAEEALGPETIVLRVLSDNAHAIAFYERLGFVHDGLEPLHTVVDGERTSLVPAAEADADAHFLRMRFAPARVETGEQTILTAGPSITGREASYALDATKRGWNGRWNGYLTRFERTFAEYVGAEHAIAMSSCTGALHLSLLALGIGPGDEVIVPDITWVATANAVAYTGATPVFADVEDDSWCLDPAAFEAAITPRTRAVMPVHLYGHPANLTAIRAIAGRYGVAIVEDAAPAIGAEVHGTRVGTAGAAAAFSFQGAKLLVAGEGGMLVTNDDQVFERARKLWNHGHVADFWIDQMGWKYKLSNVQAAIGLAQMERADQQIEAKRRIFSWYEQELADLPGISLNRETEWARSIYWMTSIRVGAESGTTRDALREALAGRNVDTRPVFPAISQYPIWDRRQTPAPVAKRIGDEGVNLPSGVLLRRDQVAYVCEAIRASLLAA
jgi:perosamine synthetase